MRYTLLPGVGYNKLLGSVFLIIAANIQPIYAAPDIQYKTEKRIVQYMRWEPLPDALSYELRIEKLTGGRWQPAFSELTETNEIKTALEPGEYRYRVDVIDLLGRRRQPAGWARLTVLPALQPELTSFEPVSHNIRNKKPLKVGFTGKRIELNAQIFLVSADGIMIPAETTTIGQDKNNGEAVFTPNTLKIGYYSLVVRNPGGLEAALPTLAIIAGQTGSAKMPEATRFIFEEGYMFMLPLTGSLAGFFNEPFYPAGITLRFAYLPLRGAYGRFGVEVEPAWNYMESKGVYHSSDYVVYAHMFSASIHLLYRKDFLNGHLGLTARAGGGMSLLYDLRVQQRDDRRQWIVTFDLFSGLVPIFTASLGLSYIFNNNFFLEAGAEFRMLFDGVHYPSYAAPLLSFGFLF
ncbi:MAG: hypothetical protein LBG74_04560 [Spirochaetaceae bacterium]|jgi:hypothetical protein|nr:hypothetical protein [Spirochaetaceae bacterium]